MGTCFVEFDRYYRMVTCLKKYHHSVFPDPKKKEGRKINVELRYVDPNVYLVMLTLLAHNRSECWYGSGNTN